MIQSCRALMHRIRSAREICAANSRLQRCVLPWLELAGMRAGELARLLLAHPRLAETKPLFLGRVADEAPGGRVPLEQVRRRPGGGTAATAPRARARARARGGPDGGRAALGGGGGGGARRSVRANVSLKYSAPSNWELIRDSGTEIVFLALPHESLARVGSAVARAWGASDRLERCLAARRCRESLDLQASRPPMPALGATLQQEAVYGCPELHREEIASARLVANPSCCSTSIILGLAPLLRAGLVDLDHGIVCDAKSGVSGAGKAARPRRPTLCMRRIIFPAYAVFGHRHTGEMLEQLGLTAEQIQFTPHLLPIPRGIFVDDLCSACRSTPSRNRLRHACVRSTQRAPWCACMRRRTCRRFSMSRALTIATWVSNSEKMGSGW